MSQVVPDPTPPPRPTKMLHHRNRLHRPARSPSQTRPARHLDPRSLVHREQGPLGSRRHLRRRPIPDPHRHRTPGHGSPAQRRHRRPTPERRHQHRRRQPPPRPRQQPTTVPTRHHLRTLPGPWVDCCLAGSLVLCRHQILVAHRDQAHHDEKASLQKSPPQFDVSARRRRKPGSFQPGKWYNAHTERVISTMPRING